MLLIKYKIKCEIAILFYILLKKFNCQYIIFKRKGHFHVSFSAVIPTTISIIFSSIHILSIILSIPSLFIQLQLHHSDSFLQTRNARWSFTSDDNILQIVFDAFHRTYIFFITNNLGWKHTQKKQKYNLRLP